MLIKDRITASLEVIGGEKARQEKDRHGGKNGPAMLLISGHPAKRIGETR